MIITKEAGLFTWRVDKEKRVGSWTHGEKPNNFYLHCSDGGSDQYYKAKKLNALSQSSWQIGLKYGTWFWMNKIQDKNTELKKSVVQSVSLCLSYLFLYILTSKFIKNWKKKLSKQKKFKPWILLNQMCTEKQMRAPALRHWIYFF